MAYQTIYRQRPNIRLFDKYINQLVPPINLGEAPLPYGKGGNADVTTSISGISTGRVGIGTQSTRTKHGQGRGKRAIKPARSISKRRAKPSKTNTKHKLPQRGPGGKFLPRKSKK